MPEVSVVCAATLLAELGTPETFQSARQVLKLAGMNLAGRSSGMSVRGRVKQTKRGRPLLRRELFLLAGRWCQRRGLARPLYEAMRTRGLSKTAAVCAVARKLVPVVLHILKTGVAFDEARWLASHGLPPRPPTAPRGRAHAATAIDYGASCRAQRAPAEDPNPDAAQTADETTSHGARDPEPPVKMCQAPCPGGDGEPRRALIVVERVPSAREDGAL
jgi:hypothetical protein